MSSPRAARRKTATPVSPTNTFERPKKKIRNFFCSTKSLSCLACKGIENFNGGDFNQARVYFSQALRNVDGKEQQMQPKRFENNIQGSVSPNTEYDEGMFVYRSALPLHEDCQQDLVPAILCYNIAQTDISINSFSEAQIWLCNALNKFKQAKTSTTEAGILLTQILSCLGYCYYKRGDSDSSLKFYERCLTLTTKVDAEMDEHVAAALNCIGVLLFNQQSQASEACQMFKTSLRLYKAKEKDSNEYQIKVATVLNNIGRSMYLESKFEEALLFYGDALKIRRQLLGNGSIDVAATLYNIGQTHQQLCRHQDALTCYDDFLKVAILTFGEKSRDVALVCKAIAEVYHELADLKQSFCFLKRALTIHMCISKDDKLAVASTLNKLGNVCYELKDFVQAMKYYLQGLQIERQELHSGHPHIIITLTNIAHIYKQQGDYSKAVAAYKKIHEMQVESSEGNDIQIAETLTNVGLMEYHLKEFTSSFESYQEALRIRRCHFGTDDHPEIACILNSIGLVLFKQGFNELAKSCFYESLRIRIKVLGKDHRDVAILWYNIATIHYETGEDDLAIKMFEETLRVERIALGKDHPDVVVTMQHLGQVYQQLGKIEMAITYLNEALNIERRNTASKYQIHARLLNLLGNAYLQLGQTENMMKFYTEASRIYESKGQPGETLVIAGYNFFDLSRTNPPCAEAA